MIMTVMMNDTNDDVDDDTIMQCVLTMDLHLLQCLHRTVKEK